MNPFVVVDGRVLAQRLDLGVVPSHERLLPINQGGCLHGAPLSAPCGDCAADINFLKENESSVA